MLELSNESIRKELIEFLKKNGIKNRFIAKKIDVSDTTISLFINGKRELSTKKLQALNELIHNESD